MCRILFTTRTGQPSYLLHFMFPMKTNLSYIKQIKEGKERGKRKYLWLHLYSNEKNAMKKKRKIISFKKKKNNI